MSKKKIIVISIGIACLIMLPRVYIWQTKQRLNKDVKAHKQMNRGSKTVASRAAPYNALVSERKDTWDRAISLKAKSESMSRDEFANWVSSGDPNATYLMGREYYDGSLFDKDYNMAANFFLTAAEQSHSQAMYYLGIMYFYGEGVPQDHIEGLRYILQSQELNNPYAMVYFARSLEENGAYENAITTYSKAMAQFHAPAFAQMARLALQGNGMEQNPELAYAYVNIAVTYADNAQDRDRLAKTRDDLASSLGADRLFDAQILSRNILNDLLKGKGDQ